MIQGTRLRVAINPMRGWQANKRRTCAWPVVLGLYPKLKNHPLGGWIFITSQFEIKKTIGNSTHNFYKKCDTNKEQKQQLDPSPPTPCVQQGQTKK